MDLRVGARLRSVVCDTEVIVVRSPGRAVDVRCGGQPMVAKDDLGEPTSAEPRAGFADGALLGKRYADADQGLELLVTRPGTGTLSLGEVPLPVKDPKRLPSSD
jgi:hypothetical protein